MKDHHDSQAALDPFGGSFVPAWMIWNLVLSAALAASTAADHPGAPPSSGGAPKLMYTTYFYTAGEAVVNGYEDGTHVRIVSLEPRGTIWEGKISAGEAKMIKTGAGTFGFLADKKATILVGTPSSCSVVGYWLKDQDGRFSSTHFYTQLPSRTYSSDERVTVWAYQDTFATVVDKTTGRRLKGGKIKAGGYLEIAPAELVGLGDHVLDIRADGPPVATQVYYDQGFIVPAANGRGVGRLFYTYAGKLTNGSNDLNIIAQAVDANVTVTDVDTGAQIFKGRVPKGTLHTDTLIGRRVKVVSDADVSVAVAAFKVVGAGYAEQHFGTGAEGTGIETDFRITSSGELWLFSYFDKNPITVTDSTGEKVLWSGTLDAARAKQVPSGLGLFHVRSSKGISVMGGFSSCGADYSPAGAMFAVDEALLKAIAQVHEQRVEKAKQEGRVLTAAEAAAPLSHSEGVTAANAIGASTGRNKISLDEINERAAQLAH